MLPVMSTATPFSAKARVRARLNEFKLLIQLLIDLAEVSRPSTIRQSRTFREVEEQVNTKAQVSSQTQ